MKTAGQLRIQLLERAAEDEAFRVRLLEDPHAAIKEELDVPIPEGFRIRVLEDSANTTTVVLPPRARLKESELESVSAASWLNDRGEDDQDRSNNAPLWWDANDYDE